MQLATGETRSLRKSTAFADINVWLLLLTSWYGQEHWELGWSTFHLEGICMQACDSLCELLKCMAGIICDLEEEVDLANTGIL